MSAALAKALDRPFYARRLARLGDEAAAAELDGLLLLDFHDVVWATGFWHSPSERPIGLFVPAAGDPVLIVPRLEQEHAEAGHVPTLWRYDEYPGLLHPVLDALQRIRERHGGSARVAVDALDASLWAEARAILPNLGTTSLPFRLRASKEREELGLARAAAHYADLCLRWIHEHGPELVRRGASEATWVAEALAATRAALLADVGETYGDAPHGVTATVHAGERAALPHGRPGGRAPRPGDVVIAGIGASVAGYHAESGATFVVGGPTATQRRCLQAADDANRAAIDAARPGVPCDHVDDAAMAELRNAGFDDDRRHRLGHGMGVAGHEAPWLAPGDTTALEPGFVVSSEPGIYRPGTDGYRTIDSLVVTEAGVDVISRFQSSLPWEARIIDA